MVSDINSPIPKKIYGYDWKVENPNNHANAKAANTRVIITLKKESWTFADFGYDLSPNANYNPEFYNLERSLLVDYPKVVNVYRINKFEIKIYYVKPR